MKYSIRISAALLAALLLLTGCGKKDDAGETGVVSPVPTESVESVSPGDTEPSDTEPSDTKPSETESVTPPECSLHARGGIGR